MTILFCMVIPSRAQLIAKDSTGVMAIELDEVTVKARSVIEKGDHKVVLPTRSQLKTSSSGLELLNKLQLPRIMVDVISGEVTVSGNGEVQLRINGIQVTYAEIAALNPEDVLRIEYHDSPGARYGGAAAVIDYITRVRNSGLSLNGEALHGIGSDRTSIDDMFSGRYNYGKSEISANVHYLQRKGDWTREYDEWFHFPDKQLHQLETGEPTLFNKKLLTSNLTYSLQDKGKYLFNAQLRYTLQDNPAGYEDRKSKLYTSDSDIPLSIYDHTRERNHLPALDLYYQQSLKHNQQLIFNLVGTYINSSSTRTYHEEAENAANAELHSDVSGKKYSLIAEGIYEKEMEYGTLSGGLKHMQAYTDNQYRGGNQKDILMRQAESYAYAEYRGKIQNWSYMANLTLSRFYYSQEDNRSEKYALQPSFLLSYNPTDELHFRYHINLKNNVPSIAYLNDIEQGIDNLQIRRGNPNLKSFHSTIQDFNAVYSSGICSIDALVRYSYEKSPIMESVLYEQGVFVHTYENQKSFRQLAAEVTFKIKPWKDHLSLAVTPGINRYISTGNNYLHTYTLKEVRIDLDASFGNWMMNFTTIAPPNRLVYGEQLMKGELMHALMAGYKQPAWSIMAGVYNPFVKTYRSKNENWSALNPVKSDIHSNNMSNLVVVKASFNLNFGRSYKGARKSIQNMDNDTGILQGTKE